MNALRVVDIVAIATRAPRQCGAPCGDPVTLGPARPPRPPRRAHRSVRRGATNSSAPLPDCHNRQKDNDFSPPDKSRTQELFGCAGGRLDRWGATTRRARTFGTSNDRAHAPDGSSTRRLLRCAHELMCSFAGVHFRLLTSPTLPHTAPPAPPRRASPPTQPAPRHPPRRPLPHLQGLVRRGIHRPAHP